MTTFGHDTYLGREPRYGEKGEAGALTLVSHGRSRPLASQNPDHPVAVTGVRSAGTAQHERLETLAIQ